MAEQKSRVICVGEVMVELARGADGRYGLSFGGDTFNTAVYLARAGIPAAYASAMGDDPYSGALLSLASAESVELELIVRVPGRMPGLYVIETDEKGERKFFYWRETSPARDLFELPDWARIAEALLSARLVYFSGVTLSLYSNTGLGRFLAALELARKQGVTVAFDGNFRPRGWKGDVARTRTVFTEALKRVDIALPTFDDEAALWGDANPEATVARLQAFGIGEIVVKNGSSTARWSPTSQAASTCRCRRWSSRSTPRRRATRSTRRIWRRGSPARAPVPAVTAAHGLAGAGDPPPRRDHAAGRGGDALSAISVRREKLTLLGLAPADDLGRLVPHHDRISATRAVPALSRLIAVEVANCCPTLNMIESSASYSWSATGTSSASSRTASNFPRSRIRISSHCWSVIVMPIWTSGGPAADVWPTPMVGMPLVSR